MSDTLLTRRMWIKDITLDELPVPYQAVAQIIGLDNAIRLSEHIGGLTYYFPKIDFLITKKRDEAIRKEFDGTNHRFLANKYRLSEIWIRRIVARNGRDGR